jgi:hypothetical protein
MVDPGQLASKATTACRAHTVNLRVPSQAPPHPLSSRRRDLHCTAAFCRGFYWTDLNMWPTLVPHNVPLLLALHGRDELLHCASVLRSLEAVQHPNTQVGGRSKLCRWVAVRGWPEQPSIALQV